MNTKLTREEAHFNKIRFEITALQNKCSSEGLLGSGAFCKMLCDLLLDGVRTYTKEEYLQTLNKIKSERLSNVSPKEFIELIEKTTKGIIQKHENLLKNGVCKTGGIKEDHTIRILNQLNFTPQAEHIVNEMCNEFEATYSEYLESKANAKQSLEKAEEANRISRRNFWVTGVVSSLALIVSVISVIISIYKK